MTTESNQQSNNSQQPRYQPPGSYSNMAQPGTYSWPDANGSPNGGVPGYNLPPVIPVPPDSMPYLTPPSINPQAEIYRRAAKRAEAKLRFFQHLRSYIIVNIILWSIAIISSVGSWGGGFWHGNFWSVSWPIWVTLFWGIGLVSEYVNTFWINDQRKQDMIEEEMRRMRR